MENDYQSLAHSRWDCKYHVVFVPKRRRRQLYGEIRRQLGGNTSCPGPAKRMSDH